MTRFSLILASTLLLSTAAFAQDAEMKKPLEAKALLQNAQSESVGLVDFHQGANGVLATITANSLTTGWHAIHIHEKGDCSGEGFKVSGGHANSHGASHGFMEGANWHEGDIPNIWVNADGTSRSQAFLSQLKLTDIMDKDGAAVIIHEGKDDYKSQPSGAAGDRVACGVIK